MIVRFGFAERPSLTPVLAAHAAEWSLDGAGRPSSAFFRAWRRWC
jgi:predicted alpha/beta hydrolase